MNRLIAAASLMLTLTACAGTPQWEAAMTARQAAPGRGIDGQCLPFALHVAERIPGAKIIGWQTAARTFAGGIVNVHHVAVEYHIGEQVWMLDNLVPGPIWVGTDATPAELRIRLFMSHAGWSVPWAIVTPNRPI